MNGNGQAQRLRELQEHEKKYEEQSSAYQQQFNEMSIVCNSLEEANSNHMCVLLCFGPYFLCKPTRTIRQRCLKVTVR